MTPAPAALPTFYVPSREELRRMFRLMAAREIVAAAAMKLAQAEMAR